MTEVEQEHAQAIDFTQEKIKRLESDMAYMRKRHGRIKDYACFIYEGNNRPQRGGKRQ